MTTYNWDLIEQLLHTVQNAGGYAGDEASKDQVASSQASEYQKLLLERGFIEPGPAREGGNGEHFQLTPRGSSLLSLLDSSIPGNDHPRQVLDEQSDALDRATFDDLASKAQIA